MTLDEVQRILDDACVEIQHMGWAARTSRTEGVTMWSVVLAPMRPARRWSPEMRWRGKGRSLDLAFEDALNKLSVDVVMRSEI